jgi:hypothetical protein
MKEALLSHRGATATSLVRLTVPACVIAALMLLASAVPAQATHEPVGGCSPGFENVRNVDLETFFDGRANVTICLRGNLTDFGDFNVRWSNMRHVTVRSAPGTWRAIRSRIWIDDTSSNVSLYGLTLDAGDFVDQPGITGLAINADNVTLQRNLITNRYGLAGSCVTNDATYGVATNLEIRSNRIYDCGRDEIHDHGIYMNAMDRPVVRGNWIYENAGRGVNLGPATQGAAIYRNVIADNCANPLGGSNDCSANVMFWGSTSGTTMNNNTIAFPHVRWNLSGCDDATGNTESCQVWTGGFNTVSASCFFTTVADYSGEPATSGISIGFHGNYATVSQGTVTVANPMFVDRVWPLHASRNYRVRNSACFGNQPQQTVGPPAP